MSNQQVEEKPEPVKTTFKIYKYPLKMADFQTVEVEGGISIISIVKQNEQPMMYILVDTERKVYPRKVFFEVRIIGTGHEIPFDEDDVYTSIFTFDNMGTLGFEDDTLMFHFFVRKRWPPKEEEEITEVELPSLVKGNPEQESNGT